MRCSPRSRRRRFGSEGGRGRCKMGRTPRPRSSSGVTTSWTSPTWTRHSVGPRAARPRRTAPSRSGRSCRCEARRRMTDAPRATEEAARTSYGRLVAYLSARFRDLAAAEDALGEAFRAALETWPRNGVPEMPEAWLLVAARGHAIDRARRAAVRADAAPTLRLLADEVQAASREAGLPDDRLRLLFICAHPAIDAEVRTPLMLQTVLGLDAARIASAFCVAPATMGQRLVRAKAKIRVAGMSFEGPEPSEVPARLGAVLEAIYAAYGVGWDDAAGADPRRSGLAEEAIWLARLVVQLAPNAPEARGLLALMLHCEARRPARRAPDGAYIPLSEQDVALWSRAMIDEAEQI